MTKQNLLFDFFPERRIQTPGQKHQNRHEQQNPHTELLTLVFYWLTHPRHKANQIGDLSIVGL